jgi:hypothetical protein
VKTEEAEGRFLSRNIWWKEFERKLEMIAKVAKSGTLKTR